VASAPRLSGASVVFGLVLLAAAGALGFWTAIASDDVDRARSLAQEATGTLPFGVALTEYALRNLHVVGTVAALVAAAGVASVADGIGFPIVSALLRLATGTVIFIVGAALAAWTAIGVLDPSAAIGWSERAAEFVPAVRELAVAALPVLPLVGMAAAFCLIFGAVELWRSRRGFALGAARTEPSDDGDMRHAAEAAAAAARHHHQKPKFVELDHGMLPAEVATAPTARVATPAARVATPAAYASIAAQAPAAAHASTTTFSADPAVVQAIERMLARLGGNMPKKLDARQKAALAKLPLQQQETIARFVDLVPAGPKLVAIAIGAFILLQIIPSLFAGFIGR
jgi:hypothetical protein